MTRAEAETKAERLTAAGFPTAVRWAVRDGYVTINVEARNRYARSLKAAARRDRYAASVHGQTTRALCMVRYRAGRRPQ